MKPALNILLCGSDVESAELNDLASGLRRAGHDAQIACGTDAALGSATPDVLIVTEAQGTSIISAFTLPENTPRTIFIAAAPDFEVAAAASRAGANEICCQPGIDQLVEAVERTSATQATGQDQRAGFDRSYSSDQQQRAMLDLLAHTTSMGVERSLRLRIATATCELFHNSHTHGYAGQPGPITIKVSLAGDPYGIDRLAIEVEDFGAGSKNSAQATETTPNGFDFVQALSERLDTESTNSGFIARVEFALAPVHFDEDPADLDALDFFDHTCLREVFEAANENQAEPFGRATAPTVGRILAAGQPSATALLATPR